MPAESVAWRTLGASVRGASHVRDGLPNQDAQSCATRGGVTVAAVADGHGGARHFRSADGARLAVQAAHEALFALAPAFAAADPAARAQLAAAELPMRVVSRWVQLAQADLAERPINAEELAGVEASEGGDAAASVRADPLLAYGATLLAALALPGALVLAQLGDGDMLVVDADGNAARPVPHDERLRGSFTTSICRAGAEGDFRSIVLCGNEARPALVLLSTDGYANSFRADTDYLKVGTDFLDLLRCHGLAAVEQQLSGILEHASTHGSGDDITLAMLVGDVQAASPTNSGLPAAAPLGPPNAVHTTLARQRQVIVLLLVALLAVVGWTQRQRLAALWQPEPARGSGVPEVMWTPEKPVADTGLAPDSAASPAGAASAAVLVQPASASAGARSDPQATPKKGRAASANSNNGS